MQFFGLRERPQSPLTLFLKLPIYTVQANGVLMLAGTDSGLPMMLSSALQYRERHLSIAACRLNYLSILLLGAPPRWSANCQSAGTSEMRLAHPSGLNQVENKCLLSSRGFSLIELLLVLAMTTI